MSLEDKLFDWQKELINNIKTKYYGLFLDCGLGKTVVGLSLAEKHKCNKILIITINAKAIESEDIKGSFFWWAKQSNINYTFYTKNILKKCPETFDENSILILNYESLLKKDTNKVTLRPEIVKFIKSCKDQNVCLLIDESHLIANLTSKRSKLIFNIKKQLLSIASNLYYYLMSGTPAVNGYISIYAQLKFLNCPLTKEQFIDNFCITKPIYGAPAWVKKVVGYKNIEKLFTIINNYGVSLETSTVIKLPEQIFDTINKYNSQDIFEMFINKKVSGKKIYSLMGTRGDISKDEMKEYNVSELIDNPYYRNIDYPNLKYLADTTGTFALRARELSIGFQGNSEEYIWYDYTRLNNLERFLSQNEDNYILFYSFIPELCEIYPICEKLGYNISVYSGDIKDMTAYNNYSNLSDTEKLESKKTIVIANWQSASTGQNLQEFNKVIIFDLPIYRDWAQGLKRVHRIGQNKPVIYYDFTCNNMIDNSMREALEMKVDYTDKLFESGLNKYVKNEN